VKQMVEDKKTETYIYIEKYNIYSIYIYVYIYLPTCKVFKDSNQEEGMEKRKEKKKTQTRMVLLPGRKM